MGFLHLALLGGTLLAAAPVILHLVMRQQPKLLEFPALRFIQQRRESNRRRLRLRHWLLLALRVAAIVLLAAGLARPFVRTSSAWIGDREAPVAAALVFDTSARMQYRQQNQTRLEQAQEIGEWLLRQLPDESQAAVLDSRPGPPSFQVDLAAAQQRVARLEVTGVTRGVPETIESAVELLSRSELERKEIYLFTDLTQAAFPTESLATARKAVESLPGAAIYVVDVGATAPQDFGLGPLELNAERLPINKPLRLGVELRAVGDGGERTVESYVRDATGKLQLRGRQSASVTAGGASRMEFLLSGLPPGVHQGEVRIAGADALSANDVRYFTVEVRPAQRVLIGSAPPEFEDRAVMLSEALSPTTMRENGQAPFACDVVSTESLGDMKLETLESYAAVLLNDPRPLSAPAWQRLHAYAFGGGGIGIFVGHSADPLAEFNSDAALDLLPGKLLRQARYPDGDLYLAPNVFEHPLLAPFRLRGGSLPWIDFPVFRYWQWEIAAKDVSTLIPFSNGQPALLERIVGSGRVLALSTPVSQTQEDYERDDTRWNYGAAPLPSFVLVNEIALYLSGNADAHVNYLAGQDAVLRLPAGAKADTALLTTPRGEQFRVNANQADRNIAIASVEYPGHFRANAGGDGASLDLGFSVNLAPGDTELVRAEPEVLKSLFGESAFRLARSRDQINRELSLGRVGRELFPLLAMLVALILGVEQVMANRFYRDRAAVKETPSSRPAEASVVA
jgi:hypothetical protein